MSVMKRLLTIISICALCLTAQAQVVIGVTRTGQLGTAGENLQFVDQFGNIVAYPSLSPTGEIIDAMLPAVVTNLSVTGVTKTEAATGGRVVSQGANPVTECGICYSTSPYPTIQNSHIAATADADGNFSVSLTGLQPNTTYYVRAYATNTIGTSYGSSVTFTTRGDATITITGKSESKVYNAQVQSLSGYTVYIPNGVNIDETEITYSGNASATGTTVGTYPLTYAASDFSCSNTNYDVTFTVTDGALTITKAAAEVTANNATKVYGESDPNLTATVTGTINNDALNYTLARTEGEDAGTYAITVTLGDNPNYDVTATNGTFTITKATATVQAPVIYINYGEAVPTFTATETGVLGDDHLNYTLNLPTSFENHGGTAWAIAVQLGENPNYEISATDGLLTIKRIAASITVVNKSKVYGATDPELTATVTGTINGDELNYTLARATGENVGDYAITVTKGINNDYEVTVTNGTLTITPAAATVKADDKTKVAGESDPTFTATVTGLKNNDAATVITYTFSRTQGETVGSYTITPSGAAEQGNYTVTYQTGTLTITEPPCPTLGTTTYTPNPVTSSATTITLTTPVNNVTTGVTVSNPQYTATMGTTPVTVSNVSYSNGTMTGTITITTAMRGNAITVTPSITTAGCENPGTLTGDAVEICVQPTLPSFETVSNTNGTGKTNLFYRGGVYPYATINNYDANLIKEMGFYYSSVESEVTNHTCTPTVGSYGTLDISSYQASDFRNALNVISTPAVKATTTALYTLVDISYCNGTTYYQPYMVVRLCGDRDTTIYGTKKSFTMWKPENMAITANPSTLTSGGTVTLTANAEMTIESYAGSTSTIQNAYIMQYICPGTSFSGVSSTGNASMDTWVNILNNCNNLKTMMGGNGTTMSWSYSWDNGATGKTRAVSTAGTYTAYGNFTLNGVTCTVDKSITITTAQ